MDREEKNNYYRFETCSRDISTESVGYVFMDYLTRTSQTLEDVINNHFHKLYHLCYQQKCCQCTTRYQPSRSGILNVVQLDILFDSLSPKSSCHRSSQILSKFCCSKARSGVTVKDLDLTLMHCLINNCCSGLFWESCLNGGTFTNFLNQNKHDIYHLWMNNLPCCQCFSGYIFPCDRKIISEEDWNFLFSAKGNPCLLHNITPASSLCCCVSATPGITVFQIEPEVETVLLRHLSFLKKSFKTLIEFRNLYSHINNCSISNSDFNQNWLKMVIAINDCLRYGITDQTTANDLIEEQTRKINNIKTLEFNDVVMRRNKEQEKVKNEILLQMNTFVETKGCIEAKKYLEAHSIVFLTGHAGSGKSRIAFELLRYFHEMKQFVPIKLTNFQEFSSLISTDFKSCVLLEDIFGRTNYVFNDNTDASILNDIKVCTRGSNVKVIITIRSFILSSCKQVLQRNGLWFPMLTVDLSEKFMLNKDERKGILNSYEGISVELSGKEIFLDKKDIEEIVEFDTAQGFPECCRLFFTNENYSSLGVNFFKHPTELLLGEIETLRKCRSEYLHSDNKSTCKLRYITLVYCLLNGDKFEKYKLDMEKVKTIMKSVYGEKETSVSTQDVIDAADELISLYLLYNDDTYTLQHRLISESVLISYSDCDKLGAIKVFSATFIAEMVKPETYQNKTGEVVLKLPVKYYRNLVNVFIDDLMLEKTDFVFIQYTLAKSEMVKDFQFLQVFNEELLDKIPKINPRAPCYAFLDFVVLNLSKNDNTQEIKLLWEFLIFEYSKNVFLMSAMVAMFNQLDNEQHLEILNFMFENSNMQFKENWLYSAIGRGSFYLYYRLDKLCTHQTKIIDFNEVEFLQIFLDIACRANKIELVTRLIRRILSDTNLRSMFNEKDPNASENNDRNLFNTEHVLCEACRNEDDYVELPRLLMKMLPSNDYPLQKCLDAALKSENINVMKYLISNHLSLIPDLKKVLVFSFRMGYFSLADMVIRSRKFEPIDLERAVHQACLHNQLLFIDRIGKTMLENIKNFDKDDGTPLLNMLRLSNNVCETDLEIILTKACATGVNGIKLLHSPLLQKHINGTMFSIVSKFEDSSLKSEFMTICKSKNINFHDIFNSFIDNENVFCMFKEFSEISSFENLIKMVFCTKMLMTAIKKGNQNLIKSIIEVFDDSMDLRVLVECFRPAIDFNQTLLVDFILAKVKHENLNCVEAFKDACAFGQEDVVAVMLDKCKIIDDCSFDFLLSLTQLKNSSFKKRTRIDKIIERIVQHCYCEKTLGKENHDSILDFSKCDENILVFPVKIEQKVSDIKTFKFVLVKQKELSADVLNVETSKDESVLIDILFEKKMNIVDIPSKCSSLQELKKDYIQKTLKKVILHSKLDDAERNKLEELLLDSMKTVNT